MRRRRSQFTFMVAGKKCIGKSTFINTLLNRSIATSPSKDINMYMLDVNCEGVNKRITAIDTPGLGSLDDTKNIQDVINFIKLQLDKYLAEETKVRRDPAFEDTRIHCLIYFITPGNALKPIDIELMKMASPFVNIIPVIGKSDALTKEELYMLRRNVSDQIEENNIGLFNTKGRKMMNCADLDDKVPLAVVCNEERYRTHGDNRIEVDNPIHCDFTLLKEIMFSSHCESLVEYTDCEIYESYRTEVLSTILSS